LVLGQVKINENITKKLMHNDNMLENINSQIESLSSAMKNQLSFNKMIEIQISQIATTIPVDHSGKAPGLPEISFENVNAVAVGPIFWTAGRWPLPLPPPLGFLVYKYLRRPGEHSTPLTLSHFHSLTCSQVFLSIFQQVLVQEALQ
jgi:hypothetical protein